VTAYPVENTDNPFLASAVLSAVATAVPAVVPNVPVPDAPAPPRPRRVRTQKPELVAQTSAEVVALPVTAPTAEAGAAQRVVGIDLSLTATGIVALTDGDHVPAVRLVGSTGSKDATLAEQSRRHSELSAEIIGTVYGRGESFLRPTMVVIEGPALGNPRNSDTSSWRRAGVWWQVVQTLVDDQVPVVSVPPSVLKKFATGKGNAAKTAVALAVQREWPEVILSDDNICDALGLAMVGAAKLGLDCGFRVTVPRREVLGKIDWR
jgi:crossover junction endodeoxyribonuclease RuvC